MKPNNNKEQQKIILVGALFVAMLAVLGYNLFGAQGTAAPTPAPSPGAPGAAGGPPAPGASPGAPVAPPVIFNPQGIGLVTSGRDPFVPAGASTQAPTPTPPPIAVKPVPQVPYTGNRGLRPDGEMRRSMEGILGISNGAGEEGGAGSASSGTVAPVPLPPPAPPEYVVTGVVLGDKGGRDVAILRGSGSVGQEDRKFVTVGEDVGNGFYVAAIRADGILLKSRLNATQSPVNISLGKSE